MGCCELKAEIISRIIDDFAPPIEKGHTFANGLAIGDEQAEVTRFYVAISPSQLYGIINKPSVDGGVYVAYFGKLKDEERLLISFAIKDKNRMVIKCIGDTWRFYSWGVASKIARDIDLVDPDPVKPMGYESNYKVVTFVPLEYLAKVRDAAFSVGAGRYGQYSKCSFSSSGKGTFLGSRESKPSYGEAGRFEEIQEERLEVVVPSDRLMRIITSIRKAHPYEQPVIEAYRLHGGKPFGEGRTGALGKDGDGDLVVRKVSAILKSRPIYTNGQSGGKNVMIWDGDPVEGLRQAIFRNVDIYVGKDSSGMARIVGNLFSGLILEFPSYCFAMAGARELVYTLRERSKQEDWGLRTFLPARGL